jgi:hypothetical protein
MKQSKRKHMYKKYHNMLQVVLAVSSSSGGQNKSSSVYEEIKDFMQEDLFVGDRMVSNFYESKAKHK